MTSGNIAVCETNIRTCFYFPNIFSRLNKLFLPCLKFTIMMKTHGGARQKAGRKPVDDKALQITIYPKTSLVKKVGGIEKAKIIAINALLRAAK